MRVVNSSTYRNFNASVNDVHNRLNKAMNKVASGAAYETAADNPLAYYEGKQLDNLYQDAKSQSTLLSTVKNRLYEQEKGAYSIQTTLRGAKSTMLFLADGTHNADKDTVQTKRDELLQRAQSIVTDLNNQYGSYFVFGGNDLRTPPFSLSADGSTLSFTHQYADGTEATMTMTLKYDAASQGYHYDISDADMDNILKAMKEQSRVDVGYGDISQRDTLVDTFTGGLNVLTGLSSDTLRAMTDADAKQAIREGLDQSALGLISAGVLGADAYVDGTMSYEQFSKSMNQAVTDMAVAEHSISRTYADLGNRQSVLDTTETRLKALQDSLQTRYTEILGADPYASIMEMFSYQNSYAASLKVGAQMMRSSLFDFMA